MKAPPPSSQLLTGFAEGVNAQLITPTREQQAIIARPLENIIIRAFAGTGKTSTLLEYTKRHATKKFIYLAFNKSISTEAQKKFPANVTAQTTHSLAYQQVITEAYKKKLVPGIKPHHLTPLLADLERASIIHKTLKDYCLSADPEITEKHLPQNKIKAQIGAAAPTQTPAEQNDQLAAAGAQYLRESHAVWQKITNPELEELKIDHEIYLKLLALKAPKQAFAEYDGILIDEAQDSNGVTVALIKAAGKPIIAVGDGHQAIYGFRGAWNALSTFTGTEFILSESFRFGYEIAALGNLLITRLTKEKNLLRGRPEIKDRVGKNFVLTDNPAGETMLITRTNAKLIEVALDCIAKNIPYHIIGGCNEELFRTLVALRGLVTKTAKLIKNETVAYFHKKKQGLAELKEYAEKHEDLEIMTALPIYQKHEKDLFAKIKAIKRHQHRKNKGQPLAKHRA